MALAQVFPPFLIASKVILSAILSGLREPEAWITLVQVPTAMVVVLSMVIELALMSVILPWPLTTLRLSLLSPQELSVVTLTTTPGLAAIASLSA